MKKFLAIAAAVSLTLGTLAVAQPAAAQAMCSAQNNFGAVFWGWNPGLAMRICQLNTPVGGVCVFQGC
jgi:hypothetical protein